MANLLKNCLYGYIGLLLLGFSASLLAQEPVETATPIPPVFSISKLVDQSDKHAVEIPFFHPTSGETEEFRFTWNPNCELQDSLYFLLRGVAWVADLYLNGKFISSHNQPLSNWWIALPPDWILPAENTFTLRLYGEGYFPNYPQRFNGLLYPIEMYEQPPSHLFEPVDFTAHKTKDWDSVWVWVPYFGKNNGPIYDSTIAQQNLSHILQSRVKCVHFPFSPPIELIELLEEAGLRYVDTLRPPLRLAMLNTFPYEEISFTLPRSFWLDKEGKRTALYGQFIPWEKAVVHEDPLEPGLGTLSILLFPLFALLVVKFANPSFYYSILRIFTQPDKYIDSLQEASPGNSGFSFIVLFINLISVSVLVFLFVYLIHRSEAWEYIQFFREDNLLTQVFYPTQYASSLFIRSLVVVSLGFLLKYLLLGLLGSVFSIRNMASGSINLDIITNFPYLQFLSIPLILVLISPGSQYMYGGLFIFLGIIFFLRKLYTYFYGLERLFDFSLGVKILYICAFNILPYIIWF